MSKKLMRIRELLDKKINSKFWLCHKLLIICFRQLLYALLGLILTMHFEILLMRSKSSFSKLIITVSSNSFIRLHFSFTTNKNYAKCRWKCYLIWPLMNRWKWYKCPCKILLYFTYIYYCFKWKLFLLWRWILPWKLRIYYYFKALNAQLPYFEEEISNSYMSYILTFLWVRDYLQE